MRFDLIAERDRFIPGWYGSADHGRTSLEFATAEFRWPKELHASVANCMAFLRIGALRGWLSGGVRHPAAGSAAGR